MQLAMIAASLILAGSAQAQSLTEKYELSERCGKQAAEVFVKEGKGNFMNSAGQAFDNYENHYNSRLNICFYLETSNVLQREEPPQTTMVLRDLNENRKLAGFLKYGDRVGNCWVLDKYCTTEEEWRALIKPFMED